MKRLLTIVILAALFAAMSFAQLNITGAGATFPFPMYSKWFDEYHKLNSNIQINYQSIGSGGGINQVTEGTVDFGGSDAILTDAQIKAFKDKRMTNILAFPTVMGADVPIYNVAGVASELNFTQDALAGIFLGKITKWNDAAIAGANPGVKLPAADIIVVHRSDASGTTFIWTDYLAKVSPEWKMKVGPGAAVNWPVGLAARGNEGVSGQVKQVPNTLGYVELIFARQNKMTFGKVRNKSGAFIKADLAGVSAAAVGATMADDFHAGSAGSQPSITDSPGKTAYPISSFTWLLVPEEIKDKQKAKVITDFLKWMLGPGQKMTEALDFAQLPAPVVAKELKAIAKVH
jgi:phosphate transport system substrate-binding protein